MSVGYWILPQPGQDRLQANSGSISTMSGYCSRRPSFCFATGRRDPQVLAHGIDISAPPREGRSDDSSTIALDHVTGPKRGERATTRSTSESGADAPAVIPTVRRRASGVVELGLVLDETGGAAARRRPRRAGWCWTSCGEPTTSITSHSAASVRTASWRFCVA